VTPPPRLRRPLAKILPPVASSEVLMAARQGGKRDLVKAPKATLYAQRDQKGRFKDVVEKGKSLARDRKTKARTAVKPGYGHRGDQKA
jgi:hypothetical protein